MTGMGFFALHGVFSAEEIAAVRSAIDPLEAQADAYLRTPRARHPGHRAGG